MFDLLEIASLPVRDKKCEVTLIQSMAVSSSSMTIMSILQLILQFHISAG